MHAYSFSQDADIWQDAPVLIGSTRFEPRADTKNIMITGGAGFMYDFTKLIDMLTFSLIHTQCIMVCKTHDSHLP